MDKRDYYDVLGIDRGADKSTIKKSYRKIAMANHPDRNPDNPEAEEKFKEASEAAEILLDESKRQRYDQLGHAGMGQQGGGAGFSGGEGFGDLGDIFGDIFGDILGGGRGRQRGGRRSHGQPGSDLQMPLNISFEEAAFGLEKNIKINKLTKCTPCQGTGAKNGSKPMTCSVCHGHGEVRRQQGFFTVASACPQCQGQGTVISDPCHSCRGEGRQRTEVELEVKIPAGIDEGQRLKLTGEGDAGKLGGRSGDLYVQVQIRQHDIFERDGHDVYCSVPISFSQAALGAELEVPTLAGKVAVKIPPGTQAGKKMRLRAQGISRLGGHGMGDQIISIHVETPTKLTVEQRDLFKSLADSEQSECNPMTRGFFDKVKDLFQ